MPLGPRHGRQQARVGAVRQLSRPGVHPRARERGLRRGSRQRGDGPAGRRSRGCPPHAAPTAPSSTARRSSAARSAGRAGAAWTADSVLYAPLTDAGATAYHAVQTVIQRLKPGTSAAIIGIGGLGTYAVEFVKLLSSARIFAVDNIEARLQTAREVGADEVVLFTGDGTPAGEQIISQTGGRGVDAIVNLVGTADTLRLSAKISRPRGRIVLVGMQGGTLEVGWGLLATSCEFAISLGSTRQDLKEVCELARAGKLRIDIERFSFDELGEAYNALRAGTLAGRAVVVFP
ncbi:uncharacterized protein F4812DRAFT_434457 [Daldinia caldariorum]|uniref:uncharacterized protein n=1 Tax=Daldinia caldariorum TaxID=326644 RepID=UPI00200824BB|nr:uncharacterized protein F4812DRAFT_434457 [Daldinia caldariorum]KAI1466531.1 hypothetical protein F4812DRAFT_434457 [Daldinia caldariorum]